MLLWADSFDLYTVSSDVNATSTPHGWDYAGIGGSQSYIGLGTSWGRFTTIGLKSYLAGVGTPIYAVVYKDLGVNRDTLFSGVSFCNKNGYGILMSFRDGSSMQMEVRLTSGSRYLTVTRNGTVLATSTRVLPLNQWHRVEFKVTVDPIAGSYEVRVDGVTWLSASGINTQGATTKNINRVYCGLYEGNGEGYFDDYMCWDDQGDGPTDFIGDCRIQTKMPTANGSANQWTASAGSNYQCVDEIPSNTTDYVASGNVGDEDRYLHAGNLAGSTVVGLLTMFRACKDDANIRSLRSEIKSGATVQDNGTDFLMSSTWAYYQSIYNKDPNGDVAWTIAAANAAEFGVKVTA